MALAAEDPTVTTPAAVTRIKPLTLPPSGAAVKAIKPMEICTDGRKRAGRAVTIVHTAPLAPVPVTPGTSKITRRPILVRLQLPATGAAGGPDQLVV